jgi:hypothetical protein
MTGKIFINYRRDDSISTAGRLHDRLAQTFARNNLFMDVDHLPAGVDFVDYLNSQVAACDIFLAIIGPNWLNAKDDSGRRRFDNPDDFVSVEIAAALARNIRVIPVLVDGAHMPKADNLPDSIKPLVRRNAVEVRNTHFGRDAEALVEKVREALQDGRPVTGRWSFLAQWRKVAGCATALLFVGWIGLYQMSVPVWVPWTPRGEQSADAGTDCDLYAAEQDNNVHVPGVEFDRIDTHLAIPACLRAVMTRANPRLMHNLARSYDKAGNFEDAAIWYGKAAELGFAHSQNNLGVLYIYGRGVQLDVSKAVQLIRSAAAQNNANAVRNYTQIDFTVVFKDSDAWARVLETALVTRGFLPVKNVRGKWSPQLMIAIEEFKKSLQLSDQGITLRVVDRLLTLTDLLLTRRAPRSPAS